MKRRGMGEGYPPKENIFASISSCEKLKEVLSWIDIRHPRRQPVCEENGGGGS